MAVRSTFDWRVGTCAGCSAERALKTTHGGRWYCSIGCCRKHARIDGALKTAARDLAFVEARLLALTARQRETFLAWVDLRPLPRGLPFVTPIREKIVGVVYRLENPTDEKEIQ